MKENKLLGFVILCLSIIIILFVLQIPEARIDSDDFRKIVVTGENTVDVSSDQVDVFVVIRTLNEDITHSKEENDVKSAALLDALSAFTVQTQSYSLQEQFRWNSVRGESESIGFETRHVLKVSSAAEDASSIIDIVSRERVQISHISFSMSDEKKETIREKVLENAVTHARNKADALASASGSEVKEVLLITEDHVQHFPYRMQMDASLESSSSIAEPDVSFAARVVVTFRIQ